MNEVILWILVALCVIAIFIINSLIMKKNAVLNAFAGVDVQLKKRCDLIPNLVASVKTYMEHEAKVLTDVTAMRNQMHASGASNAEKFELERQIGTALRNVMVQLERYPDLKASANMIQLLHSINEVEEQVAAARRFYNAAATDFNNAIQMIPGVFFAPMLKLHAQELFTADEEERKNVDVDQLFHA